MPTFTKSQLQDLIKELKSQVLQLRIKQTLSQTNADKERYNQELLDVKDLLYYYTNEMGKL